MSNLKQALRMASLTFIIAILVTLSTTGLIELVSLPIAIIVLLFVVIVGIVFDTIGVAATAADQAPLNAKAAKKVFGAKKALLLVRNAAQVATFCCDIVGDICGTVSGALGAVILLRLSTVISLNKNILEIGLLALVASLTVGGKAYGKQIGIDKANDIMFHMGKLLSSIELLFDFGQKGTGGSEEKWLSSKKWLTRKNLKS